jgi:hypothetical protein
MATIIGISAKPKTADGSTCTVPIDSLEQDGTPPEEGDDVSFSVDGTVQSIDGDNATIKIEAINGEPTSGSDDEGNDDDTSSGPSADQLKQQLMQGAAPGAPVPGAP